MPNPRNEFPDFCCAVCKGHRTERVIVKRPDGRNYETQFFYCKHCTAMFLNPRKFTVRGGMQAQREEGAPVD